MKVYATGCVKVVILDSYKAKEEDHMEAFRIFIVCLALAGFASVTVSYVLGEIYARADRREVARYTLELHMAAARSSTQTSTPNS